MAAIWLLVAISVVSLQVAIVAKGRRLAVANEMEHLQGSAAADGGVEHARAVLAAALRDAGRRQWTGSPGRDDPWRHPEALLPDTVTIAEVQYVVEMHDPSGRLHLNRATEDELRRLLVALPGRPVDARIASQIAQRIADWRDRDQASRPQGAESADYLQADRRRVPSDAPFADVEEVRDILGVTPDLMTRLRPYLTVHGTGQVNVNAAARPVLLALPGMTEPAAEIIGRMQENERRIEGLQQLLDLLPVASRTPLQAETARLMGRLSFDTREVVVRSTGWRQGSPVRAVAEATFARAGTTAMKTWTHSR